MDAQLLNIAGLNYLLPSEMRLTSNYLPFIQPVDSADETTASITIGEIAVSRKELCHKGLLIDDEKELSIYKVKENGGGYYVSVKSKHADEVYELFANLDWSQIRMSPNCASSGCSRSVLDIILMLIFIYSAANYQTVLLHASCVKCGEHALAFIGHSGAGKSTHSRLWLTYVPDTKLLNDDQPAVRVYEDGKVIIYGTPWSGKTLCYVSDSAPLAGIVRMKQSPFNRLTELKPVSLFQELLSSCSMMKEDPETFKLITSALTGIASHVQGFVLENRPEKEAVSMVYAQTIQKI